MEWNNTIESTSVCGDQYSQEGTDLQYKSVVI